MRIPFILLTLSIGNTGWATTAFERMFCGGQSFSEESCNIPATFPQIQQALANEIVTNSEPPANGLSANDQQTANLMQAVVIPEGRSLQKDNTSYEEPRIVLSMPPGFQDATGNGYKNPLGSQFFLGFSPRAKTLEMITYDPDTGKNVFFRIDNYPPPPGRKPKITRVNDNGCTKCHQSGGAIFSRAPWAETNSSLRVAQKLCESQKTRDPSTGKLVYQNTYQGVKFADECPPKDTGRPPGSSSPGRGGAVTLDTNVRLNNRLLQSRNACQSMCGSDVGCRKALIQSALDLPRSPEMMPRINFGDPQESEMIKGFLEQKMGFTPAPSVKKGQSTESTNLGASTQELWTLRNQLQNSLGSGWDRDRYDYPSSVLPDRDPLAQPPTVQRISYPNGADANFEESSSVNDNGSLHPTQEAVTQQNGDYIDPEQPRPKTGTIPKDFASLYAMDEAFSCLGFQSSDSRVVRSCAAKVPNLVQSVMSSAEVSEASQNWPLGGNGASSRVRFEVMQSLRKSCGMAAETENCPTQTGMPSGASVAQEGKDATSAAAKVPPLPPSGPTAKFQTNCLKCHDDGSYGPEIHFENYKEISGEKKPLICQMLVSGKMPPPPLPTQKPLSSEEKAKLESDRTDMEQQLGCAQR